MILFRSHKLHLLLGFHFIIYAHCLWILWVHANWIDDFIVASSSQTMQINFDLPAFLFYLYCSSLCFLISDTVSSFLLYLFNFIMKYSGLFYSNQLISVFSDVCTSWFWDGASFLATYSVWTRLMFIYLAISGYCFFGLLTYLLDFNYCEVGSSL